MNKIWNTLKNLAGIDEYEEYSDENYYIEEDDYQNNYQEMERLRADEELQNHQLDRQSQTVGISESNNVIDMPRMNNGSSEMLVFQPTSFEEMPQIIQALQERKSVIINLNSLDPEQGQRAIDFIAGGTYAMDGHQERIGEDIFLFVPSCVRVSTGSEVVHEVNAPVTRQVRRSPEPIPAWEEELSVAAL